MATTTNLIFFHEDGLIREKTNSHHGFPIHSIPLTAALRSEVLQVPALVPSHIAFATAGYFWPANTHD